MILLGGDLFHDNKPSPKCLIRCTEMLRKYCLGDKEVEFELVSDQAENFHHTKIFPYVNFEEENLNVSLPVFSIHGNHDDPTGKNPLSYLEAISASGLINYFGKYVSMEKIEVRPLLLQKGRTKLALFGLGSLPEERLHRFFLHNKIKFLKPQEDRQQWFNLLVVHQNRVPHGTKYLPEKFLGHFPDLVVWGHEHESKKELEYNAEMGFYVLQPGSTVATSLCPGEAEPKHVSLLEIAFDESKGIPTMEHSAIPLKSVRQFYFENIDLDDEMNAASRRDAEQVESFCERKIKSLIDRAELEHSGDIMQPELPLIRLRLESSFPLPFSTYQFGLKFKGKVANPNELLLFKLKRKPGTKTSEVEVDTDRLEFMLDGDSHQITNIEDIVEELLTDPTGKTKPLDLLSERHLTTAVRELVEKDTPDSVETVIENMLLKTRNYLMNSDDLSCDEGSIADDVKNLRLKLRSKEQADKKRVADQFQQLSQSGNSQSSSRHSQGTNGSSARDTSPMLVDEEEEDNDDDDIEEVTIDSDEEDRRRTAAKSKQKSNRGLSRR